MPPCRALADAYRSISASAPVAPSWTTVACATWIGFWRSCGKARRAGWYWWGSPTVGVGPRKNAKLSLERAKKIAQQLQERGVHAVDIEAMGSELPVASNDTDSGREKNRRVEVWLR
ncbi:MAG: OmpA family protein [Myxococcales bacterium]